MARESEKHWQRFGEPGGAGMGARYVDCPRCGRPRHEHQIKPSLDETRDIIQNLIKALAKIRATPRHGGPASIGPARVLAYEAIRTMPMRYLPRRVCDAVREVETDGA